MSEPVEWYEMHDHGPGTESSRSMSDAIFRYEVPVDDRWHRIELSGALYSVGCRTIDVVEFWALSSGGPAISRDFRVYGTGHPLPAEFEYVGTAVAPGGALVWHLVERPS